jgi:bifunctional UDP-N-acetylglucosamine pyrophosphorylase/glucosamine-1-phosphate N-acetyltransferase
MLSLLFYAFNPVLEKEQCLRYSRMEYVSGRFTMSDTYAVILAAGKGTRMKSRHYKVLHPVCGKPMIQHIVDTAEQIDLQKIILVVGHGAEKVKEQLGDRYSYVLQEEQLGTGHAVIVAKDELKDKQGITLLLYGDTPLITKEVLEELMQTHRREQATVTILTALLDDPTGYGRIIRNEQNDVLKIVEHKDASEAERRVREINTGIYCFDNQKLMWALDRLNNNNAQGEYYITDCVEILKAEGEKVSAYLTQDTDVTLGVNDRVQLADVERKMQRRINEAHMRAGVTLINPEQTQIEADVRIGQDSVIYPGVLITGQSQIGEDCTIGPNTELHNAKIGNRVSVKQSVILDSTVGDDTTVGPFAYIRPGSEIGQHCRIGDFVEIKNSSIAAGTKIPHLSYVGDADIGKNVNIGCGAVTVNYDGQRKHRTIVGDDSFIGCNVNLVAPVEIGKGAYLAAGSTITDPVSDGSFAIARERQVTKENYVQQLRAKQFKK